VPITPEELTRRVHAATPFIATLGIEILEAGGGRAVARMPVREALTQDLGHPHGGVVGALADFICNLALRTPSVTVEYKVNFLRGAPADALRAEARIVREGRSIAVAEAQVFAELAGQEDLQVALATATLAPMYRDRDGS
jgi:uncharacterized protein (TIGR00369 family)